MVFVFHILHPPPLCYNLPRKFHLHSIPNILTFVGFFFTFRVHVLKRFELIHIDQHKVSFKLLNGHQYYLATHIVLCTVQIIS